jgi:multidrug transporter EmrE-like cation transporter
MIPPLVVVDRIVDANGRVGAIVCLGVVGSVVGFTLYFYVLKRMRAGTASLITLITPVSALMIGSAFNGERVNARAWAGTLLVLAGLSLHGWGGRLLRRQGRIRHRHGDAPVAVFPRRCGAIVPRRRLRLHFAAPQARQGMRLFHQ